MKSSGDLIASISSDLADNNAGLISAEDVRHNMEDIAYSINKVVASGDTDVLFPFFNDVRAKKIGSEGGTFIPESGLIFPNSPVDNVSIQTDPWLGPGNIQHNDLGGLTAGDPHSQYVNVNGTRAMAGNLALDENWINSSGEVNGNSDDNGIKFRYNNPDIGDDVLIGTSGHLEFNKDQSAIDSFHGAAKAWISFAGDATTPVVNGYYNVSGIQRITTGTYKITFTSGVLANNNYVAIGTSNGLGGPITTYSDMEPNSVALLLREGDDGTSLRSIHFRIEQEAGNPVDASQNDLVIYGMNPGSQMVGPAPTVS
jgi:hypothetical protein